MCHGDDMTDLLSEDAVAAGIAALDGWSGDATGIHRTVEARDFLTGIRLVDAVALTAEAANHHPDIDIRWRRVTFTVVSHDAGGITQRDLDLAAAIDALAVDAVA
jgi:4a-hydroxytetrahydrobiopterin dehydratase